jgi:hypothetical protein
MAEVLESHLRETLRPSVPMSAPDDPAPDDMDEIARILRTYLK